MLSLVSTVISNAYDCTDLFFCSVVLFVDEADAFLRKRSKVSIFEL